VHRSQAWFLTRFGGHVSVWAAMPLPLPTERDFSYSSGVALVEFRVDPQAVIEDLDPLEDRNARIDLRRPRVAVDELSVPAC
jgi:hypothetical protein